MATATEPASKRVKLNEDNQVDEEESTKTEIREKTEESDKDKTPKGVKLIERGTITFFYRPKIDTEEVHGVKDVQRFYILLSPDAEQAKHRLLIVGRKLLPSTKKHGKHWAVVDMASTDLEELVKEKLRTQHYDTATRGERTLQACRPVAFGTYAIASKESGTYLAYRCELPKEHSELQEAFGIAEEGSFIISVKNPKRESKKQLEEGSSEKRPRVTYPDELQALFEDKRFIHVADVKLLDYAGAEIILIGAARDVEENLGEKVSEKLEEKHVVKGGEIKRPAATEHEQDVFQMLKELKPNPKHLVFEEWK